MNRLVIASLAVLGSAGCTPDFESGRPPIEALEPGLNLIDTTDPTWGMTAAYVKADRVVYLEQRVGALKPQSYRDEFADEPANEIDMRFVDKNGRVFFVQRGGDEYVDPTWAKDIDAALANPASDVDRIADFALAKEAATEIAKLTGAEFAPFTHHAQVYAARPVPTEDPHLIASAAKANTVRPDVAYAGWNGGSVSYWLQGDLYDKDKGCAFWVCVAKHSGVAMWAYNGSSWQLAVHACNHGSCPGSMSYRCSSNSGVWRSNVTLSGEHNTGSSIGGGCRTPYDWNSGGYDHLCNDDSAYELWQIKNGSVGSSAYRDTRGNGYTFEYNGAGTGGDGSWVNYACDCSQNNDCNNDWSRPHCM